MNVSDLGNGALIIVVSSIMIGMGAQILTTLQTQQVANGTAYNITGKGLTGLGTFGDWIPLIALVMVAAIVIGIIVGYLGHTDGRV